MDKTIDEVFEQLLERFEYQSKKKVRNYPFLMGEGIWMDSEKLDYDDEIGEVIKHGTLTVGFVGLAETLIGLIGKHHGESEEAQQLGLRIVQHMRDRCDEEAKKTKLNFSLIASPAESTAGSLLRADRKKFGIIEGITDKEYYTNSVHVMPEYNISAFKKIKIEAPYHAMCNGGVISYIELDGDPRNNIDAMDALVHYACENDMNYFAINHDVDMCPLCGYTGIIGDTCPRCGRKDGEGIEVEKYNEIAKKYHLPICRC